MKKMTFKVPFYKFDITLVQVEGKKDAKKIKELLVGFGAQQADIDEVVDGVRREAVNGGDTFREMRKKKMLLIFYLFDSERERQNVYSHEKRHVEDRLMEWCSVNDIESAGMLAGYLGEQFWEFSRL